MGNAGLGSNLVLEFHVAGERLESLRSHHCCGWLWNAKLTGIGGAHARPGSSALELQRNAIAFLDTGHWTPDAARRCNPADFGYNPIRLSVLSLDLFASQLSISRIVLVVIDIGELFFFLNLFWCCDSGLAQTLMVSSHSVLRTFLSSAQLRP